MHLTEAIMDLKNGNTKDVTEMNLTDQGIKAHEQEIKGMMMEVKGMMAHMKGNTTSSSIVSKNAPTDMARTGSCIRHACNYAWVVTA